MFAKDPLSVVLQLPAEASLLREAQLPVEAPLPVEAHTAHRGPAARRSCLPLGPDETRGRGLCRRIPFVSSAFMTKHCKLSLGSLIMVWISHVHPRAHAEYNQEERGGGMGKGRNKAEGLAEMSGISRSHRGSRGSVGGNTKTVNREPRWGARSVGTTQGRVWQIVVPS